MALREADELSAPLLALRSVTLAYGRGAQRRVAVSGVGFQVAASERLVLLGPSGCGKSSLLRALAGYEPIAGGQALLRGRPISGPGTDRIMVFQEFDQLLAWKTVRENLIFPLVLSGRSRAAAAERADALLARVGLAEFAAAYPHILSGGMKQRTAIARALALEPALLLMDEPFAALDALTRRRMQDELLRLWRETPFTLVFVTHSIEEAVVVGSRILLLSPGPGRVVGEWTVAPDAAAPGSAEGARLAGEIHRRLTATTGDSQERADAA
jgi:NitT/TauT family transport system ATP-binding protein